MIVTTMCVCACVCVRERGCVSDPTGLGLEHAARGADRRLRSARGTVSNETFNKQLKRNCRKGSPIGIAYRGAVLRGTSVRWNEHLGVAIAGVPPLRVSDLKLLADCLNYLRSVGFIQHIKRFLVAPLGRAMDTHVPRKSARHSSSSST